MVKKKFNKDDYNIGNSEKLNYTIIVGREVIGSSKGDKFTLIEGEKLPEGIEKPFLDQFIVEGWVK